MISARRGALFMNPASGTADRERAGQIRAAASEAGLQVFTLEKGLDVHAEVRQKVERGEKLFVAAGGDGTVHTVTQALIGTDGELAVLPVGTWNHFARDIGVPLDWREALEVALTGTIAQIDVGRVNDRFFVNNLSLGFYPELVQHREKYRHFGKWRAYLHAISAAMKKFPRVVLAVEAPQLFETIKTHVFMVSVNAYDLGQPSVRGSTERPRLSIFRSVKHIYAQIVDDTTGKTLLAVNSDQKEPALKHGGNKAAAAVIGKLIASKALAKGITQIAFDRSGYKYHGRVKALADAAREAGLKF